MAEVTGMAQRSAPDGIEGALSRAERAIREAEAARRVDAMLSGRKARPARRRLPFDVAVRSEQAVSCTECTAAGATWEESVLIHHGDGLPAVPGDWHGSDWDRGGRRSQGNRRTPMIFRTS